MCAVDLKYVSSIAEGRASGGDLYKHFILPRLCSPRCWMASHDPVKCELWTGLVGPCHLGIVGPSGSRTTVQWLLVLQDLLPDGFAMGGMSRARDLGYSELGIDRGREGGVGDLKYVSSIAEGRASGGDHI